MSRKEIENLTVHVCLHNNDDDNGSRTYFEITRVDYFCMQMSCFLTSLFSLSLYCPLNISPLIRRRRCRFIAKYVYNKNKNECEWSLWEQFNGSKNILVHLALWFTKKIPIVVFVWVTVTKNILFYKLLTVHSPSNEKNANPFDFLSHARAWG